MTAKSSQFLCSEPSMAYAEICKRGHIRAEVDVFERSKKGLHRRCVPCRRETNRMMRATDIYKSIRKIRLSKNPVRTNKRKRYTYLSNRLVEFRNRAIDHFGGCCVKCKFSDRRALQFDHVHGGGSREKKGSVIGYYRRMLGEVPGNKYQLLCANCNFIKREERKEYCHSNTCQDVCPCKNLSV